MADYAMIKKLFDGDNHAIVDALYKNGIKEVSIEELRKCGFDEDSILRVWYSKELDFPGIAKYFDEHYVKGYKMNQKNEGVYSIEEMDIEKREAYEKNAGVRIGGMIELYKKKMEIYKNEYNNKEYALKMLEKINNQQEQYRYYERQYLHSRIHITEDYYKKLNSFAEKMHDLIWRIIKDKNLQNQIGKYVQGKFGDSNIQAEILREVVIVYDKINFHYDYRIRDFICMFICSNVVFDEERINMRFKSYKDIEEKINHEKIYEESFNETFKIYHDYAKFPETIYLQCTTTDDKGMARTETIENPFKLTTLFKIIDYSLYNDYVRFLNEYAEILAKTDKEEEEIDKEILEDIKELTYNPYKGSNDNSIKKRIQ